MQYPPFGVRIKTAREAAGLTQAVAAEAAGISQPYLADLEAGKKDPETAVSTALGRLADLKTRLAKALGVESL